MWTPKEYRNWMIEGAIMCYRSLKIGNPGWVSHANFIDYTFTANDLYKRTRMIRDTMETKRVS